MPVRISVILTTYNSERTLQRVLDSVFNQEGINKDFEIELIVVDDCSTDNTREILRNNNIEFYSLSENSGGPNKGRNIGLSMASGDYFCIMDHDDEWFPDKIKTQLSVSHLAPVISSGYTVVFEKNQKTTERYNKAIDISGYILYKENETFLSTLSRSNKGQSCYIGSVLVKRNIKIPQFEEYFGKMDYDWGLQLLENNASVEICRPLYKRHVVDSNLSLNSEYRALDFYYSLMILDKYSDKYPKHARLGYKRFHGSRAKYFYLTGNMKNARFFFTKAGFNLKNIIYYLTTFAGSGYVKKKFTIFG